MYLNSPRRPASSIPRFNPIAAPPCTTVFSITDGFFFGPTSTRRAPLGSLTTLAPGLRTYSRAFFLIALMPSNLLKNSTTASSTSWKESSEPFSTAFLYTRLELPPNKRVNVNSFESRRSCSSICSGGMRKIVEEIPT